MTPICDFPPKFFFSSNSQFKSSVAGDNQRTAVDPTKVLHAKVCGTFVDSGCVFVCCSNQIELSDQRAGDGRKSMEIGQFRIRIRPDKLHHVLDQRSNPTSFTVVGSKDHSRKPRSTSSFCGSETKINPRQK